jgi:hypothetical protein
MKLRPRAANSVFGSSRQILQFGCVHGFVYGDHSPLHVALKRLAEWMLSAEAMSVLEQLASRIPRFYERFLATVDIRSQAYISSCAYAQDADAIEASLINFGPMQTNLRLQNVSDLAGTIFPEPTPEPGDTGKREAVNDDSPVRTKSRPVQNMNPHPSLALLTYAEWDLVRLQVGNLPKIDGEDVCARFHCRQACYHDCRNCHGRLSPTMVKQMEKWIASARLATAKAAKAAAAAKAAGPKG